MTRLEEAFPPGWKRVRSPVVEHLYSLRVGGGDANAPKSPKSTIRRFNLLYSDAVRVARSMNLDEVIRALQSDLQLFVATEAPSRLFVHAGVVAWRGRAILVPGTSFSGKTTLVAAMVRAGASYYSDEYAVLDSRGRVHPYARALLVREGDAGLPRQVRVEEIGGRAGHKPFPIGLVVDSPYKPGSTWRPPTALTRKRRDGPSRPHGAGSAAASVCPGHAEKRRSPRSRSQGSAGRGRGLCRIRSAGAGEQGGMRERERKIHGS